MKFNKLETILQFKVIAILAIVSLIFLAIACRSSSSNNVASLEAIKSTPIVEDKSNVPEEEVENEAVLMAFTQCMREQGVELKDPKVDSNGNIQPPEPVDPSKISPEQLRKAFPNCQEHLEGLTFGGERPDISELVDQLVEVTTCLREKGFDVDDPTANNIMQWRQNFRQQFDFNDPKAQEAFQECNDNSNRQEGQRQRGPGRLGRGGGPPN